MGIRKMALRILAIFGVEVWRARGGVFVRSIPRRSRRDPPGAELKPTRLNLGSGSRPLEGFTNVDIVDFPGTDLVTSIVDLPMIASNSVEVVRLDATFEHLYRFERPPALREWFRVLKPGGELRINWVPDFEVYAQVFVSRGDGNVSSPMMLDEVYRYTHGEPAPWNAGDQLHKDVFTKTSVCRELEAVGFEIVECRNVAFGKESVAVCMCVVGRKPLGS